MNLFVFSNRSGYPFYQGMDQKVYFSIFDQITEFLDGQPEISLVGTALRGRDGIKKLDTLKVDVVLADVNLPDLTAVDLIQRIKELDPRIKVVVMSRGWDPQTLKICFQAGAKQCLSLPLDKDQLVQMLRMLKPG